MDVAERLERRLERRPSGCLEWTGYTVEDGYGRICFEGRSVGTHRIAWSLANDQPIPDGMHVLHHCDNPPCCETEPSEEYPEGHLFLGTNGDNMRDRDAKGRGASPNRGKTHCIHRHAFSPDNTYLDPSGRRQCRECRNIRAREYRRLARVTTQEEN